MKLTSPQTYKVVRFALSGKPFKQIEAEAATGVSFGLVNRVVNWLVGRGFAVKQPDGRYRVTAAASLAAAFAVFRNTDQLLLAQLPVDVSDAEWKKLMADFGASYCLSSALAFYDDYFQDPSFHVYGTEALVRKLTAHSPGERWVYVYRNDLEDSADFIKKMGVSRTTALRTAIDLLCSKQAYAVDRLKLKLWSHGT